MLNLSDLSRRFLTTAGALAREENGDETLAGLTVSESDFFLMYHDQSDAHERFSKMPRFQQLMERHLSARQLERESKTGAQFRAAPDRHAGRVERVLDDERHAVQGAASAPLSEA